MPGFMETPATLPQQMKQESLDQLIIHASRETFSLPGPPPTKAKSMTSSELARSQPPTRVCHKPSTNQATGFSSHSSALSHLVLRSPHGSLTHHGTTLTSKLLPRLEPLQLTQSPTQETVTSLPLMLLPPQTQKAPPPSQTLLLFQLPAAQAQLL